MSCEWEAADFTGGKSLATLNTDTVFTREKFLFPNTATSIAPLCHLKSAPFSLSPELKSMGSITFMWSTSHQHWQCSTSGLHKTETVLRLQLIGVIKESSLCGVFVCVRLKDKQWNSGTPSEACIIQSAEPPERVCVCNTVCCRNQRG